MGDFFGRDRKQREPESKRGFGGNFGEKLGEEEALF